MKWTDRAVPGFYHKLSIGIGKLTDEELLAAINNAYAQLGIALISEEIAGWVSRRSRLSMVLDLMVETNFCEEEKDSYWIDPAGNWKIVLP